MRKGEGGPGQTQDTLERLYLSAGLWMSWCYPRRSGGGGWEEGDVGFSQPVLDKQKKMDG